jgi:hypothetical protein
MILSHSGALGREGLIKGVLTAALTLGVLVPGGLMSTTWMQAQNIGQRVVTGVVVDDTETHIQGATVFLKDLKTKTIRSFTTAADGQFRFTQVNMAEDHEVWAEMGGKKSAVKTISSWDARKTFEAELKLK